MKHILKNVVKNALILFTVGVTLAIIAPAIASLAGIDPATLGHTVNPLWTGSFFGAFGALSAMVTPLVNRIFEGNAAKSAAISHASGKAPVQDISPAVSPDVTNAKFQAMVEASRAAAHPPGKSPGM